MKIVISDAPSCFLDLDLLARWDTLPLAMRAAMRLLLKTAANEKST